MSASESALARTTSIKDVPFLKSGRPLGHVHGMATDPLSTVVNAHADAGDIVRVRLGHQPAYFLSGPREIKRVLVDDADGYAKTTRGYELLRLILGNGLVTSEGDFWLRQRRIAQPGFHKKCLDGFAKTMVTSSHDLSERWGSVAKLGTVIDVAEAMNLLTLRIAGETLMSVDMTTEAAEVSQSMSYALARFNNMVSSPLPFPHLWPTFANLKLWRSVKSMHRVVDKIIADRRQSQVEVPDLLGMFMSSVDEETGEGMSDVQLRDEVLTMLLAGHETTANSLSWTLYLLSLHPEIMGRMQAELDVVLSGRAPSVEDLGSLSYTAQVVKESMRLYPPVWMLARKSLTEREMSGYRIKKGAYVFFSPWAIHRNPKYWPHPEAFDPERFGPDREQPDRFTYLPFSRGQRQCIGDRFAEMESILVLATLLQKYSFSLVPGQKIEAEPSVTLRPRFGIKMSLIAR
jgi:cytochrome P450